MKYKFFGILSLFLGEFFSIKGEICFIEKFIITPIILFGSLTQLFDKLFLGLTQEKKIDIIYECKPLVLAKYDLIKFVMRNLQKFNKELESPKSEEDP